MVAGDGETGVGMGAEIDDGPEGDTRMKGFLFANVPLSVVHFVLFVLFGGFLGWPGTVVAQAVGAAANGVLWWVVMVLNSLVWGAVLSLFVLPFIRKLVK